MFDHVVAKLISAAGALVAIDRTCSDGTVTEGARRLLLAAAGRVDAFMHEAMRVLHL